MALNASSVSLVIERSELTLAVLAVYADMSGTERKVERQRRGKGADRVMPEAQWSGVEINSPSLHHRESASLGCLRGETRKSDKSCATGENWRSREGPTFRAGSGLTRSPENDRVPNLIAPKFFRQ